MDDAADYAIKTLILARSTARVYHDPALADRCAKSIEYVQNLANRAQGWASRFPRDDNEPDTPDDSRTTAAQV